MKSARSDMCDIHNRNTRYSKLNLNCPRYKRETEGGGGGGHTFTAKTIKAWNSITSDLKNRKVIVQVFLKETFLNTF